ncbi:MAG: PIG-L deacetylase family protein [Hyphomicrobiaceae bacterium]
MIEFSLAQGTQPKCILFLGAHCDDIEIGCGGTILTLVEKCPQTRIVCVTLSSDPLRAQETRDATSRLLEGARSSEIIVGTFKGSYFPYIGDVIKDYIEQIKISHQPDVIFTHRRHDLHQDHRITNELTWNTFRDHLILEYEITKYDGDISVPNTYVPLTRAQMRRKTDILMECFPSQHKRQWFTRDTFEAIARIRGIECNASEGYAEAFFGRKIRLSFGR